MYDVYALDPILGKVWLALIPEEDLPKFPKQVDGFEVVAERVERIPYPKDEECNCTECDTCAWCSPDPAGGFGYQE
jgi:hypothetical protein